MLSRLFQALSQPSRVEILLAIGSGEVCVCHLEAVLKMRQAYISQHLMALRQAGILATRREGRFIFYRLVDPAWMDLIRTAAEMANIPQDSLRFATHERPHPSCGCPHCAPSLAGNLIPPEHISTDHRAER
jgi:ArsR family transcriptional regulator